MNLMAWFRKNNKKLMAVVVIALMIVFTIEPVMSYLSYRRAGGHTVVARYGDNKKIKLNDRVWAQKQLEILKLLKADVIFRPMDLRLNPSQELRMVLLGEVLFAERAGAAETINYVRQLVRREGLAVSDRQINDLYEKKYSPDIYWLLLTNEARDAGVRVPLEQARNQLEIIIPRLRQGLTYSRYISELVKTLEVSEEQILDTFAELMGIVEYARILCSNENCTTQQILLDTISQDESMDAQYVAINANVFVSDIKRPGEERIKEQFEMYKDLFDGDFNESNPYGFGYKLPDKVRLEYIIVRMEDVASTVHRPSQEELEDFYQQNVSRFVKEVPSDPNDPNSEPIRRTLSFAEMAGDISKSLYRQRVNTKALQIISEAKSQTEEKLSGIGEEQTKITDEEIQRLAGDYGKTAADLTEKYEIKVYNGKTGLLSAVDMMSDRILSMMYIEGSGFADVSLVRAAFAVEPLKASELGPVDIKPPRLFQNIGPLRDARSVAQGFAGKNMMLARIVKAQKAAPPESIDQKIVKQTISFDESTPQDVNTVGELVVGDLKRLAAMDKAKRKSGEFVKLAAKDGWDNALEKLNEHLGEPNRLTIESRTGIRRLPQTEMLVLEDRYEGDPMAGKMLSRNRAEKMLIDDLYALVPEDANTLPKPGVVVEFKSGFGYYCVKDLVIHRLYEQEYDAIKAADAANIDFKDGEELAITFYTPENIIKRTNFEIVREGAVESQEPSRNDADKTSPSDVNSPAVK